MVGIREHWRLEGYDLAGTEVTAFPTQGGLKRRKVISRAARPGQLPSLQVPSLDYATRDLLFTVRRNGGSADHHAVLRSIVDLLEERDVTYLQAPSRSQTARSYLDERLVWVLPESWEVPDETGPHRVRLQMGLIVLGVPIAFGGGAYRPVKGTFEKTATGWLRDDGEETLDADGARVRLPEQTTGYPKFLRKSDLAWAQPSRVATELETTSEGTRVWHYYDVKGFLHPAAVNTGDVCLYEGRDSPSPPWFDWASGIVTFISSDFYVKSTDAGATLIGFPQQASGYPLATNPKTLAQDDLAPLYEFTAASDSGTTGIVETYDVRSYVFGRREPRYGDANRDGSVTSADADHISNYVIGSVPAAEIDLVASDVNLSDSVTGTDSTYVTQYLAGTRAYLGPDPADTAYLVPIQPGEHGSLHIETRGA